MTKFHWILCHGAILVFSRSATQAFQPNQAAPVLRQKTTTLSSQTHVPVHEFVSKWTELEKRQRELERKSADDDSKGYDVAKEMVELALSTIRAEVVDEWEHAIRAQTRLEKASDEEKTLAQVATQAHKEAEEADDMIKSFEPRYLSNLDQWELHRQVLSVSDIAHRVEKYVESRLEEARAVENEAKQQEEEAEEHLWQLSAQVDELQALLTQLKKAAKESRGLKP